MRILLARHGETPWNAEGRYQGQEDIALSPVGEAQARALGERLRDVRIDRAVASPLKRAFRTAELALGEARRDLLSTDPGLMEIAHGEWEGLLASEIRERDGERLHAWRHAPHEVLMPQGESLQHVLDRAWPALRRATDGLRDDDTLLVVAHDAVRRSRASGVVMKTLSDWLAYIERQHPQSIALGLDRVRAVAERMQLQRPATHVITVGGTNGKGSTVAFIDAIARAAGWRVGTYTSPHLLRYNERVRIDGVELDDATLVAAFEAVEAARVLRQAQDDRYVPLTYFEYGTLAALWCFARAGLDLVVLEV